MNVPELMRALGCEHRGQSIYRHPDFNFDFDLTDVDDPKNILPELYQLFATKGYVRCQTDLKKILGLE